VQERVSYNGFAVSLRTFWLSFHASYACRHSGACCSSGWDIDIDTARVAVVAEAIAAGRIVAPVTWLRSADGAPEEVGGVLMHGEAGRCVFHQTPGCAIHTVLGHDALPSACQHFPRIAVIDPRGVLVTLSHYCPTAASLLFDARGAVSIVEGPSVLPGGSVPEGLDARDELPPLESPRRLMDWERYAEWERHVVATLTSTAWPPDALDALDRSAPVVSAASLLAIARRAVPLPYSWQASDSGERADWSASAPVVGRYLAAHAFASWTAYQGNGLRCTVLYLRLVLAVLESELARARTLFDAIRHADLLLRHLADRQALADELSALAVQ
jgi:hypothetical protein